MLWVCGSFAKKSSTWAISTPVCGPSDTTIEKPTPLLLAQSNIEAVSAPDCETKASEPRCAKGPAAEAFSCNAGRCKPNEFGPNKCTPSRRATRLSSSANSGERPFDTISTERHAMRIANSNADITSFGGKAMMAKSALVCTKSASVPEVCTSKNCSVPEKRWAFNAAVSDLACEVWAASSCTPSSFIGPAKTTTEEGWKRGVK